MAYRRRRQVHLTIVVMCKGPRRPRCDTCVTRSDGVRSKFDVGNTHFAEYPGSARKQILYRKKKRTNQQWLPIYLIFISFEQWIVFTLTLKYVRKKIIRLSTASDDTIACGTLTGSFAVEKCESKCEANGMGNRRRMKIARYSHHNASKCCQQCYQWHPLPYPTVRVITHNLATLEF